MRGTGTFATAVGLELRKSRRLRMWLLCLVMVVAVVLLGGMSLFSESARSGFTEPGARPWEQLLLNHVMVAAMTWPLLVAVLAGRQVDIEHRGQGWLPARTSGMGPGLLCRAKALVLSVAVVATVAAQCALLIAAGTVAGVPGPPPLDLWARYGSHLVLVNLALLGLHLWLAARVDNQLVGLGVGLLGGFYAVFSLLMPAWAAYLVPWGYYAAVSPVAMSGDRLVEAGPVLWLFVPFLAGAAALFWAACRHLDRSEGGPA